MAHCNILSEKTIEILEKNDINITDISKRKTTEYHVEMEFWSPEGEDFVFTINCQGDEDFSNEFRNFARDFDEEEHVKEILNSGLSGVPSIKALITDSEVIKEFLLRVSEELNNKDSNPKSYIKYDSAYVGSRFSIIKNLYDVISEIKSDISNYIIKENSLNITETYALYTDMTKISDNPEEILKKLIDKGWIVKNDRHIIVPSLKVFPCNEMAIEVPTKKGVLSIYNDSPDGETVQGCVDFKNNAEDSEICQLVMAEIKGEELANQKDNADIDLYLYGDPYSEDYTVKEKILYEDIEKSFDF